MVGSRIGKVGDSTPDTEAPGNGYAGEHSIDQVLLAAGVVEHVLDGEHRRRPEANLGSHPKSLPQSAVGNVVVLALVVEEPARRCCRKLVSMFGTEPETGHPAPLSCPQT